MACFLLKTDEKEPKMRENDLITLQKIGISKQNFDDQVKMISQGMESVKLVSAVTPSNGIKIFSQEMMISLADYFEQFEEMLQLVKFVPASGAASRMFKDLVQFHQTKSHNKISLEFFASIDRFPFYDRLLNACIENNITFKDEVDIQWKVIDLLFNDEKFKFLDKPKGLIPFHKVNGKERNAFEEHYREAVDYKTTNKDVCMHFTVSLGYRDMISEALEKVKTDLGNPGISQKFSLQSVSTNTVALDKNNLVVRDDNGDMVFRPGGHGALIDNINDIHADLIFIRNIDNIIPKENNLKLPPYNLAMAGWLLQLKTKRDQLLGRLNESENDGVIADSLEFIERELGGTCPSRMDTEDAKLYIMRSLNRPMRVCGMVKNVGEPGGGPFVVLKDGEKTVQIIESSQIDKSDEEQMEIMKSATHFNPVDMVCATRDYMGEKYDLMAFRDVETSFIANKTYKGKEIKALEWPGLWNGAMFHWITLFMEIPLEAFNPVKTINDLLRDSHQ